MDVTLRGGPQCGLATVAHVPRWLIAPYRADVKTRRKNHARTVRVPEGPVLGVLGKERPLPVKIRGLDGSFRGSCPSEQNGFGCPCPDANGLRTIAIALI